MSLDIAVRAGADRVFYWWAPAVLSGAPTLTVHMADGDVTPAVTHVRASATVTGIATDRKTVTVNAMAGALKGLEGDRFGVARLRLDRHGEWLVRVRTIASTTSVVLAEPLPFTYVQGTGDALDWSVYYATLTSADITGTALAQPVAYDVAYTIDNGADLPTETVAQEGLLYIVRQPFETGLDDVMLLDLLPHLAGLTPQRQTSWAPQIAAAGRHLRTWLRGDPDVQKRGVTEHGVHGPPFREVHAYLTAWLIAQGANAAAGTRSEVRDDYLKTARTLYEAIRLSWPWIDDDGDGAPDSGETDSASAPTAASSMRSLFDGSDSTFVSTDFPVFGRNAKH